MEPIIQKALAENRSLYEPEAYKILSEYKLSVVKHAFVPASKDPNEAAKKMGFPLALKVVSPEVIHKSDAGGVKLGLSNQKEFKAAHQELKTKFAKKKTAGYLLAKMAEPGTEVVIGMTRDPQFGPALMFGLGGVLVEVFKDVSFRVLPLNAKEALSMIKEIKAYPLLAGARGQKPADVAALAEAVVQVAQIAQDHPEIEEIDLNPVIVYNKGYKVVDARMMLKQ